MHTLITADQSLPARRRRQNEVGMALDSDICLTVTELRQLMQRAPTADLTIQTEEHPEVNALRQLQTGRHQYLFMCVRPI